MKVICDLRFENSKKIKIITSMILILSTLFALRLKFDNQKTIKNSDFEIKQSKTTEYSQDLKERIIVNEEGVIYDSIKRENHNPEFTEKTKKDLSLIINQLNEDFISEITSDLKNDDYVKDEENKTIADLALEALYNSDDSFGDF